MKNILLFSILFFYISACSQKKDQTQVYEKYLKNGAYKVSYYNPKYQKFLDSALVILPKDPYLWQQKAMPFFKKKQYELGFLALDNALKYDDEFDTYHSYHAFIKCIFQKSYDEANREFDALISKYPKGIVMDHTYYFYKALSLLQLNRLDEAEDNLKKSFKCSTDNKFDLIPTELFYMGIVFYEKEQYEIAIKYFDDCLKQYPQFSDALYYKAKCKYYLTDKVQALGLLKEAKNYYAQGYSINESNIFYEDYPYQIKKWIIEGSIQQLEAEIKYK